MKTHTKNLIFASMVYLVTFFIVVIAAMASGVGIQLYSEYEEELDPDTMIFIASVFFIILASFAVYLVYFIIQRHKVKNDPNLIFLGLFPRIIGAFIGCILSFAVAFICLSWTSEYGEIYSILYANTALFGIIFAVVSVVNFVNFIIFKPRV